MMGVLKAKEEYVETLEGLGKEWLIEFLSYMNEKYPNIPCTMFRSRPMYKVGNSYILFSVAKTHFTVHTLDFDIIEDMKNNLPNAQYGKGCVKVKFKDINVKLDLKNMCDMVVARNSGAIFEEIKNRTM